MARDVGMSGCRDVGMYEFGKCNTPLSEHDLDLHYKLTATIDVHVLHSTIGTVTIRVKDVRGIYCSKRTNSNNYLKTRLRQLSTTKGHITLICIPAPIDGQLVRVVP